ncbi:hypothetical protein LSH36_694g01012 [Paralvinella palmiformis]|uniref:N-acetyltransferase domain-containing protein n=1 Tax=Paralvinella palmiformis TaxID=53620 RepID=A0AAD9MW55_9ANNE|nr:hypothetical protein LSH36_694g01012 [Paralvinella palmiformis]
MARREVLNVTVCLMSLIGDNVFTVTVTQHQQIEVKRVTRSNRNRHLFRQLAYESCNAVFDPPEHDRILFTYDVHSPNNKLLVAVACYSAAWRHLSEPIGTSFLDNYYHIITYIFVKRGYKDQGIGSEIIHSMEREMMGHVRRPIRLQSASKAAGFFVRLGYAAVGETVNCICGGSALFSELINMEKAII